MSRGLNAQLAVDEFMLLARQERWTQSDCWKGIAILLLSCDVWQDGYKRLNTLSKHKGVPDCVVYRERNDLILNANGKPSAALQRAVRLSNYLAAQLGVAPPDLCATIGRYFTSPGMAKLQPNNIRGHAFRSIVCAALEHFGNPAIQYEEEIDIRAEFPGFPLATRSADAKLDIIARKNGMAVALISVRWALRNDRVDVVEEALAYAPAARRTNPNCSLYGVVGEFSPNRLTKILDHCPPVAQNPALTACVHFSPDLLSNGLGVNGTMRHLKSLDWLISETHKW